ncbi:oxidoreductase [Rhizobium sp. BR 314]|uniref:oxidoreductase n=1 Tax=Rhizobium sp. BR 314 TaxID=3040013 RepID=UPI0039BEDF96
MNTWFITGVSSGFGRTIAQAALDAGDRVVGTLRSEKDRADFAAIAPGRSHGVLLDVADAAAILPTIERVEREIGPIDVLVNNAGYGHEGIVEESTLEEMRRQFDVNVFGAVAVTKAVLPGMRIRRAGRIINITSMGAFITMPGLGLYHASKFALEGFTETLGKEVKDFGIHVTAVEPGSFRTNWGGSSMVRTSRSIADYDSLMNPLRERRKAYDGRQIGDPAKLGAAVVTLAGSANPPAHLLLGSDALRLVEEKLALMQAEIAAWRHITLAMDFAE